MVRLAMLYVFAIVLGVIWIFGFAVFQVGTPAVHLLLLLAVLAVVLQFLADRGGERRAT
jgi:hypothetical protein